MNAFKSLKILTVVSLILTSVSVWAAGNYRNQDDCKASMPKSSFASQCQSNIAKWRNPRTVTVCKVDANAPLSSCPNASDQTVSTGYDVAEGPALLQCEAAMVEDACSKYPTSTETGSCDSLYQSYRDASNQVNAQCSKEGMSGSTCTSTISQCSGMMNLDGPIGDDPMGGLMNLLGAGGSGGGGAIGGCIDNSDDSLQSKQNQIDDKVYQLKKEIAQSVGKKAQKNGEVSKKNSEIEKEKIKAQQEADKIKVENQKDLAQKKAAIDKQILETKAKEFQRLIDINKESRNLANAQFKIQQFMIQYADKQVQVKCGGEADKIAEQKKAGSVPAGSPYGTKPVPKKLTKKDQQEIDLTYQTCLQVAALSKKAELKKVQDEQAASRDKIATLQASNQQDEDSIRSAQTEFDEAKKIAEKENKDADDIHLRTDANLDKSLADFKQQIADEIKGIEAENQERLTQIQNLILQKQNLKPKYSSLPGLFQNRGQAADAFTTQCCGHGMNDPRCGGTDSLGFGSMGTVN
jgi:hypothetical protein